MKPPNLIIGIVLGHPQLPAGSGCIAFSVTCAPFTPKQGGKQRQSDGKVILKRAQVEKTATEWQCGLSRVVMRWAKQSGASPDKMYDKCSTYLSGKGTLVVVDAKAAVTAMPDTRPPSLAHHQDLEPSS